MKRWHIFTDDFLPLDGGVATWAANIAAGLVDAGEQVVVWTRAREGVGFDASGTPLPYRVNPVGGRSFAKFGGAHLVRAAWGHIAVGDVVLATTWPVATVLPWVCRIKRVSFHVVFHGSDLTRVSKPSRVMKRVCKMASRRWAVSQFLSSQLEDLGFPSTVLPAPVLPTPARPESSAQTSNTRWLFVARATPLKGGDRFIRMVAASSGVEAVVVGGGSHLQSWQQLASEVGVDGRVTFTGMLSREQVLKWYAWATCTFLLPRVEADGGGAEGLGLTLVEAAMCGSAVVGVDTGGVAEAVGAGLLLTSPDDPELSVSQLNEWWTPKRGEEARNHANLKHGQRLAVEALLDAL